MIAEQTTTQTHILSQLENDSWWPITAEGDVSHYITLFRLDCEQVEARGNVQWFVRNNEQDHDVRYCIKSLQVDNDL